MKSTGDMQAAGDMQGNANRRAYWTPPPWGARMQHLRPPPYACTQVPSKLDASRVGGAGSFSGEDGTPEGLSSLGGSSPSGKRLTIKLYMVLQGSAPGGIADGITLSVTAPEPLTVETVRGGSGGWAAVRWRGMRG